MSRKILKIQPITTGYRPIRDGRKYDRYFPAASLVDRMVIGDRSADVETVVRKMQGVVCQFSGDTKNIAPLLRGKTLAETTRNVWRFLYHHIQYKYDTPGLEELRRPARLWHDKTGDCDDFAIAAASILLNLNVTGVAFRITRYEQAHFQHVYVVVPHGRGSYHIIDPVISRANYEKKYTEKLDFPMNTQSRLNGINVAILEGFGAAGSHDLVQDLLLNNHMQGLGSLSDGEADEKLYRHLLSTRKFVSENPQSVALYEDPKAFLKTLDYAIKYWHTDKRQEALDVLARNEARYNLQNGLTGFEDEDMDEGWDDLDGLSNAQITQYLRDLSDPSMDGLGLFKKWNKQKKQPAKKFWTNARKGLKKAGKTMIRFNPAVATVRAGFLLAMKLNMFKFAQRLKWAYATKEQIRGKITADYWEKAKKTLAAVEKLFSERMQGRSSDLKKAILSGKSGGLSGMADIRFDEQAEGIGAVASTTLITAATTVLGIVANLFKKNKLGKEEQPSGADPLIDPVNSTSQSTANNAVRKIGAEPVPLDTDIEPQTSLPTATGQGSQTGKGNKFVKFIMEKPLWILGGLGVTGLGIWGISEMRKNQKAKKTTKAASSGGIAGAGKRKTSAGRKTTKPQSRGPKVLKIEKLQ